jgi:chromosome segregation ATPase
MRWWRYRSLLFIEGESMLDQSDCPRIKENIRHFDAEVVRFRDLLRQAETDQARLRSEIREAQSRASDLRNAETLLSGVPASRVVLRTMRDLGVSTLAAAQDAQARLIDTLQDRLRATDTAVRDAREGVRGATDNLRAAQRAFDGVGCTW